MSVLSFRGLLFVLVGAGMKCQLNVFNGCVQCEKPVARTSSPCCSALAATSSTPIPGATPPCGAVRFHFSQRKAHRRVGNWAKYVLLLCFHMHRYNKTQWKVTVGRVSWSDSELCRDHSFPEAHPLTRVLTSTSSLCFSEEVWKQVHRLKHMCSSVSLQLSWPSLQVLSPGVTPGGRGDRHRPLPGVSTELVSLLHLF